MRRLGVVPLDAQDHLGKAVRVLVPGAIRGVWEGGWRRWGAQELLAELSVALREKLATRRWLDEGGKATFSRGKIGAKIVSKKEISRRRNASGRDKARQG